MEKYITLLYIGFATNLILSCFLTITAYNSVTALISLVFAFINTTCLFFLMELEFVGLLFLIVYVGAISVLFLFSVMLFNLKDVVRSKTNSFVFKRLISLTLTYIFFLFLFQYFININLFQIVLDFDETQTIYTFIHRFYVTYYEVYNGSILNFIDNNYYNDIIPNKNSEIFFLGQVLYNKYLLYLILTAIILLISMIGAVILINNPKEQLQMQHAIRQITRTINISNLK